MPTTLAQLNVCPRDEFVSLVGPVFERSPWIAEAVADLPAGEPASGQPCGRPFASSDQLHAALCAIVSAAPVDRQVALIQAHPDLVGQAVLTAESSREQAAAGLMGLTPDDIARFDRYNTAYTARFGFPFVICARKNKKDAILRAFPERLTHTRDEEIAIALEQIFQIAQLRIGDLLQARPWV